MLGYPPGNALPHFDAHISQGLRGFSDGKFKIEFLLFFIQQEQRPVVRAQEFVNLLHDGAENLVEL